MTKRTKARIEALEKEVKRLNFIIKNGGENKTCIKKRLARCYYNARLDISYINAESDEIKSLSMTCCSAHPNFTIYCDTKIEAIIKIDDLGIEWWKLDKENDILTRIPEPAGYTTYVKDELAGSVGMKRPTDEVRHDSESSN